MEILQPSKQRGSTFSRNVVRMFLKPRGCLPPHPPSLLSLPVLIATDRSARLFPSRVLRPPCQLWLAGSTGGVEALTQSDRSMRRPGPVHHLSAHAHWVQDMPFNAACHTGQRPPPSVSRFFAITSVFLGGVFNLSEPTGNFFLWKSGLFHLTGLFHGRQEQKHSLFRNRR